MIAKGFLPIVLTLCEMTYFTGGQHVPPGVPPQHYQQQPMGQQVPHMQQQQQQHIPVQQQQMHMQQQQQQIHMQQQQPQMHMQQQPMQQVPVQQQMHQQPHQQAHHHGHGGQPQVLNVANIAQEKEHIQEHMSVPIDTSKMTEQELQFHYFKMHDADNNNKLDGCELIKSLIHWHGSRRPSCGWTESRGGETLQGRRAGEFDRSNSLIGRRQRRRFHRLSGIRSRSAEGRRRWSTSRRPTIKLVLLADSILQLIG
uniref:Multiple coagulation factor deficiency protein 2 n=2 Tax=Lygus hesperus TaxID=30085 RepID=A0A0A9WZW8_LYGHE